MAKYQFKCHYCGTKWFKEVYMSLTDDDVIFCPKCGDNKLDATPVDEDSLDIYGYNKK